MVQEIYIRSMIAPVVVAGVLILAVLTAITSYAQPEGAAILEAHNRRGAAILEAHNRRRAAILEAHMR